jgi:4-hydroxy-tetrahydrodipicolinate synthase
MGTTGESPALDDYEKESLLNITMEYVNGRVPVFFGHGGNYTKNVIKNLRRIENSGIDGILSVCPYYNRPSQEGIYEHFNAISESTDLDILLYNIPYRTGRNIENETLLKLAKKDNIIGVKDASGDFNQSTDLLMNRPDNFSIMSGEDLTLFSSLALGADGGIVASAHLYTSLYLDLIDSFNKNDLKKAKKIWNKLFPIIPYLFKEPNPAPIKYLLRSLNKIETDDIRLPLLACSHSLKEELNQFMASYTLK